MPIYEYEPSDASGGCEHCRGGFDHFHRTTESPLEACPECGCPVVKVLSCPSIGASQSGLDDRAQQAGFTKLKRLGKGEYEKQY